MPTLGLFWAPHEGPPQSGHPLPYTAQAKGFLLPTCCVHCQCCAHPYHPSPPLRGAHIFLGPRSHGGGGQVGGPGGGVGGRGRRCSVTSRQCPLGKGPGRGGGAWRVLFYLLFPDFFVSKLTDLYYTRTTNKGRI